MTLYRDDDLTGARFDSVDLRVEPSNLVVNGADIEWSFVRTHPWDLPWDEAPRWDDIDGDRDISPPLDDVLADVLDDVLAVRLERQAMVRDVIESLTDNRLATTVTCTDPVWPRLERFGARDCARIVLDEEWEHRLYAERDLAALAELTTISKEM